MIIIIKRLEIVHDLYQRIAIFTITNVWCDVLRLSGYLSDFGDLSEKTDRLIKNDIFGKAGPKPDIPPGFYPVNAL